jgi:hypothetical protein
VRILNLTFLALRNFNNPRWQILISNWSVLSHTVKSILPEAAAWF